MTKEDWVRAFGCFWFGVECCEIFSSKVNFRSSNTKLCYNCLVSVYSPISPRARLHCELAGDSLIWVIRVRAAEQGMAFLAALS